MTENDPSDARAQEPESAPIYLSPYEAWNFGPGRPYAFPAIRDQAEFITAVTELKRDDVAVTEATTMDAVAMERIAWHPTLWRERELSFVPFVVRNPLGRIEDAGDLAQLLDLGLKQLNNLAFVNIGAKRARIAFPVPPRAMHSDQDRDPSGPAWKPDSGLRDRIGKDPQITIMAVIDDGLPFAHRNFRDASGARTRVEFCWLQAADALKEQHSVLFGREYIRSEIEDYIARYGDDEDTLYCMAGATSDAEDLGSLIDRHATHGAHVMDLATGYAPERDEVPPEAIRIIAVQLPNTIAWDTSGFGKDMYVLSAMHYIFERADRIAAGYGIERARLVINFSYGFSGGRHDGGTELEAAIDELVRIRRAKAHCPTALVLPAGNTFLDRLHARVREVDFRDGEARLYWRIQPNDRTPSYLEIWFAGNFDTRGYTIELRDPWKKIRQTIPITANQGLNRQDPGDPRRVASLKNERDQPIGQISADYHRRDCWRVLVVLAPTEPDDQSLPGIEAGKWTIVIKRDGTAAPLDHPIECWIQRSADPESLRSGSRQSYFDHLDDIRYTDEGDLKETDTDNCAVRRFGSLNGLATGKTALVVAGYRLANGLGSSLKEVCPARYSSAGTESTRQIARGIDCASMSDRSRVLPGTWAAGVRSGSLSRVQGTSTAAPFVARQLVTTFVTATEASVAAAEGNNYLGLLSGDTSPLNPQTRTRLGTVRVEPHWQPGLDPKPSKASSA
ncbi:hypothetical protein [Bradyrhizobium sp. ORS 285]|uniref:hypothetical protein n=1 Tax=Bradyrhizobium sp. ORS 285 TaxID=115808 RepID=UPI0002FE7C2F|nr:hypothetical protein [Bradyrhizobium sp. ORS 285]